LLGAKRAMTDRELVRSTVQRPVPEHPPRQPKNRDLTSGFAARTTVVLGSKRALHTVPQLMLAGMLATTPLPPSSSVVTVSSGLGAAPDSKAPISGWASRGAPARS